MTEVWIMALTVKINFHILMTIESSQQFKHHGDLLVAMTIGIHTILSWNRTI